MGRTKCKTCPDCYQTVPSYNLICNCGGSLVEPSKSSASGYSIDSSGHLKRRRTERTKRGKPNFYDALEYEKQAKKDKPRRIIKGLKSGEKGTPRDLSPPPPPHRMQLTVKKVPEEPEVKEEELEEIVLSEAKIAKFSLILDDINRKISASSWKGYF